jgi:hypothetical protein
MVCFGQNKGFSVKMKTFLKLATLCLMTMALQACPKLVSTPNSGAGTKTFANKWTTSDGMISIDLSGANMGGTPFSTKFTFPDSSYCICTLKITQVTQASVSSYGYYTNTGCSLTIGTDAAEFCSGLVYSGNYTQTGSSLVVCKTGTTICQTYE